MAVALAPPCDHVNHPPHPEAESQSALSNIIKRACAIALAIFSAYSAFSYFMPCFLLGLAFGSVIELKKNSHSHGFMSSCSQGLMGYLGYQLPDVVAVACDMIITIIHIDHHPIIGGIIALQIGAWIAHVGKQCLKRNVTRINLSIS